MSRRRWTLVVAVVGAASAVLVLLAPSEPPSRAEDLARTSADDVRPAQSEAVAVQPVLAAQAPKPQEPRRGLRHGLVLRPDGTPAQYASLVLVPKRGGRPVRVAGRTGRDGRVDLPERTAGAWLRAEDHAHTPAAIDGDALPEGKVVFRLRPARPLFVRLEGFEDFPLDEAFVEWRAADGSGPSMSTTVSRTMSTLALSVWHDGPIDLRAWHSRHVAEPERIRLEHAEGTATFRMVRGSRLTVRVVEVPSGETVWGRGTITTLRDREILFSPEVETDGEGLATLPRALPPGTYDVEVRLGGWLTGAARARVEAPDEDPTVEVRVRSDTGEGVAAIRYGIDGDEWPVDGPFHAQVRRLTDDGSWRQAPWHAVPCAGAPREPLVLHLGPMPAGVYEALVWTRKGDVAHADPVRVASDRVEETVLGLGFHEGTRVDLPREPGSTGPTRAIARHPESHIVAVLGNDGRHLPLVSVADCALTPFEGDVPLSTRLGPYPFGSLWVEWRARDAEPESTRLR